MNEEYNQEKVENKHQTKGKISTYQIVEDASSVISKRVAMTVLCLIGVMVIILFTSACEGSNNTFDHRIEKLTEGMSEKEMRSLMKVNRKDVEDIYDGIWTVYTTKDGAKLEIRDTTSTKRRYLFHHPNPPGPKVHQVIITLSDGKIEAAREVVLYPDGSISRNLLDK